MKFEKKKKTPKKRTITAFQTFFFVFVHRAVFIVPPLLQSRRHTTDPSAHMMTEQSGSATNRTRAVPFRIRATRAYNNTANKLTKGTASPSLIGRVLFSNVFIVIVSCSYYSTVCALGLCSSYSVDRVCNKRVGQFTLDFYTFFFFFQRAISGLFSSPCRLPVEKSRPRHSTRLAGFFFSAENISIDTSKTSEKSRRRLPGRGVQWEFSSHRQYVCVLRLDCIFRMIS